MEHTTLNSRNWALLLNAVEEGRVVPILGDALFTINDQGRTYSIDDYLIQKLSQRFCTGGEQLQQLSDIIPYIDAYNRQTALSNIGETTDIYYEIYELLSDARVELCPAARQMLDACHFPLVLTTSYVRNIHTQMGIAASNVGVYNKSMAADVNLSSISPSQSFLYYLFGRLSMSKRSFVATDEDLLDYMHYWHNTETRPVRLTSYLADKFFLVLGCTYPDWLFRFFWHSVKNFAIRPTTMEVQGIVSLEANADDRQLTQFLSRVQTSVCDKAEDFMSELTLRLQQHRSAQPAAASSSQSPTAADATRIPEILISYASEDYEAARAIYDEFCRVAGADVVWFDKPQLEGGDDYETLIMRRIEECKRFVPIVSAHTLIPGRRFFKKEWSKARDEVGFHGGEAFIVPIIIDDTAHDDERIPSEFRQVHMIDYHSPDFEMSLRRLVRSYR